MNVKLLTEVRDFIVKHPKNVDMEKYAYETESCGTVGCIAGWACMLSGSEPGLYLARHLLEINYGALGLFSTYYWPVDLATKLENSKGQAYANVIAERIDRFIATNGRE